LLDGRHRVPPTDDPAALITEARAAHQVCGGTDDCPERVCVECVEAWPCLTERLVRALEQVIKALDIPPDGTAALFFQAASESPYAAVKALKHIVGRSTAEYIAVRKQRDAARAAAAEQRARVGELERQLAIHRETELDLIRAALAPSDPHP